MIVALSVILVITSGLLILLVLLHKGKGGGLSDLFGGGMSSSLGGSSVVERNLDRITVALRTTRGRLSTSRLCSTTTSPDAARKAARQ